MCPVCVASAATMAAAVASGGGVTAIVVKLRNKIIWRAFSKKRAASGAG